MAARRLLIVDDEADVREIARTSLAITHRWEVFTAASGAAAVTLAVAHRPDAILLDLAMPQIDGLATLHQLRANTATEKIPVIFLTASLGAATQPLYRQAGAQGVLLKPFDPGLLGDQIAAILGWPPG
jgi:CheY-like chemotaxis protein